MSMTKQSSHTGNIEQREMYRSVQRLLEIKHRCARDAAQQVAADNQEHNFMRVDDDVRLL